MHHKTSQLNPSTVYNAKDIKEIIVIKAAQYNANWNIDCNISIAKIDLYGNTAI